MHREIKKILISTMPRSGTVFFSDFIAKLFGYSKLIPKFTGGFRPPLPQWDPYVIDQTYLDQNHGEVLCAHYRLNEEINAILDDEYTLAIYLYRDPRDMVVSSALYIKHGLPHHFLHKTFQQLTDAEAIALFLVGGRITSDMFPEDMRGGAEDSIIFEGAAYFIENAMPWIKDDRVAKVRYEDFFGDPTSLFDSLSKVGVTIEQNAVKQLSEEMNFFGVSQGRERGDEDKTSHFRKGITGDYKNYFDILHVSLAKKFIGQGLIDLGYERSFEWK